MWFNNREKKQWWIFHGNTDNGFYIHKIQDKAFKGPKEEENMTYVVSLLKMMLISKISEITYGDSYRNIAKHLFRHSRNDYLELVNWLFSPLFILDLPKTADTAEDSIMPKHCQGLSYYTFEIVRISITQRFHFTSTIYHSLNSANDYMCAINSFCYSLMGCI